MFSSTYAKESKNHQTTLKCLLLVLFSVADITYCIVKNISFYMETRKLNDLLLSALGTESTCI